jgi:hypothetical protein
LDFSFIYDMTYLIWCVYYAGKLAVQCEREELPQYAGLCWVAAARCESSLGNGSGEAWDVVRAGRQFLTAEISAKDLGCPSPGGEHVQVIKMFYVRNTSCLL